MVEVKRVGAYTSGTIAFIPIMYWIFFEQYVIHYYTRAALFSLFSK